MRRSTKRSQPLARSLRKRMTEAEVMLWSRLRRKEAHGLHFRRQHPIGPYIADFACIEARLVVEADGPTHGTARAHAHDLARDAYMRGHGWRVVRIPNEDVYRNLADVTEAILAMAPPPPPSATAGAAASTSPAMAGKEGAAHADDFAKGQTR